PLLCWEIPPQTSTPPPTSKPLGGQAAGFRPAVVGFVGPTPSPGPEWPTGCPELFRTASRLPVCASSSNRVVKSVFNYQTLCGADFNVRRMTRMMLAVSRDDA